MSIARMLRVQGKTERLGTQYKDKLQGRECMFMRLFVLKNLCEYWICACGFVCVWVGESDREKERERESERERERDGLCRMRVVQLSDWIVIRGPPFQFQDFKLHRRDLLIPKTRFLWREVEHHCHHSYLSLSLSLSHSYSLRPTQIHVLPLVFQLLECIRQIIFSIIMGSLFLKRKIALLFNVFSYYPFKSSGGKI